VRDVGRARADASAVRQLFEAVADVGPLDRADGGAAQPVAVVVGVGA
jgi:hypothetical protein